MRLLLDTHVLLCWIGDDPRLSRPARKQIGDPRALVYVSAATIWEMAIKISLHKLKLKPDAARDLARLASLCGFADLPVTAAHGAFVRDLSPEHGDPFDRLLAAQALLEELTLVTADPVFERYAVPTLAAW